MRRFLCVCFTAAFLIAAAPAPAHAADAPRPHWALMVADALMRIPLVGVSLGMTAGYAAVSPLAYMMGVGDDGAYYLVAVPWRFTSTRDLGVFHENNDGRDYRGYEIRY